MITFESKAQLEKALATQIASDLSSAIQQNGSATLLLSGGSTPSGVYRLLSTFDIDWNQVTIGLVDERFVAVDSTFSNYKLLNETIAVNSAKNVVIHPMVVDADNYEENLKKSEAVYRIFTDPDVCLWVWALTAIQPLFFQMTSHLNRQSLMKGACYLIRMLLQNPHSALHSMGQY